MGGLIFYAVGELPSMYHILFIIGIEVDFLVPLVAHL